MSKEVGEAHLYLAVRRAGEADLPGIHACHQQNIMAMCIAGSNNISPAALSVWAENLLPQSYKQLVAEREVFVTLHHERVAMFGIMGDGPSGRVVNPVFMDPQLTVLPKEHRAPEPIVREGTRASRAGTGVGLSGSKVLRKVETELSRYGVDTITVHCSPESEIFFSGHGYDVAENRAFDVLPGLSLHCTVLHKVVAEQAILGTDLHPRSHSVPIGVLPPLDASRRASAQTTPGSGRGAGLVRLVKRGTTRAGSLPVDHGAEGTAFACEEKGGGKDKGKAHADSVV